MSFWTEVLRPAVKVVAAAVAAYTGNYQLAATLLMAGVADHQTTRAKKRARDAYNAGQRDRQQMIASATNPRQDVYGNVVVSGTVLLKHSAGVKKEYLYLAVELARHEIDAIESVWIGDTEITGWDVNGDVTSGPFLRGIAEPGQASRTGAGTIVVTHPTQPGLAAPIASIVSAIRRTAAGDVSITGQVSVSGSTITITGSLGTDLVVVVWRWAGGTSLVRVYTALGSATQTAFPAWQTEIGDKWTAAHRLRGRAAVGLRLQYDQDIFGQLGGVSIKARLRGKKLFDPRTGLTVYSNNAALVTADVLRTRMGVTSAQIPAAELSAEADLCAAMVATDQLGGTQARYTCNIGISTAVTPRDALDLALETMAGSAVWVQGRWLIRCGAWRTPDITLTAADLAEGPRHVVPRAERRGLVNSVVATYTEPTLNWVLNPSPAVTSSFYLSQDAGRVLPMQISLEGATDSIRAQRLAKIELEKVRNGATFTARFSANAYDCVPGGIYYLQMDRYFGATPKTFTVLDRKLDLRTLEIDLTLREVAAGIWDWNGGMPTQVDLTPNTSLPNPLTLPDALGNVVITSGNATLLKLSDGTILARAHVSWTQHVSAFVTSGGYIEAEWRPIDGTTWISTPQIAGDAVSALIGPIDDLAAVLIRVRPVNAAGRAGPWTMQATIVAGKSAAPTAPTALAVSESSSGQRVFTVTHVQDVDHAGYLIRYSATLGDSFAAMTQVAAEWAGAGKVGQSTLPADGTWRFGMVAVDSSGNWSVPVYVTATLSAVSGLTGGGANVLFNSDFSLGWRGWTGINGGALSSRAMNVSGWTIAAASPISGDTSAISQLAPVGNPNLYWEEWGDPVPVIPLEWYCASAFTGAHRCRGAVFAYFFDAAGNIVGNTAGPAATGDNDGSALGGAAISGYKRIYGTGQAPATARTARLALRKYDTYTGQTSSYLFSCRAMFERVASGESGPGQWSPGPIGYTGDLDATKGAPAGTYVGSRLSEAIVLDISDILSDSVLSKDEKPGEMRKHAELDAERAGIVAEANRYSLTARRDAYTAAFDSLNAYLTALVPAWNDISASTVIVGSDYRTQWVNLAVARQALAADLYAQSGTRVFGAEQLQVGAATQALYLESTFDYTPDPGIAGGGNYIGGSGTISMSASANDKFEIFFSLKDVGFKSGSVDDCGMQIYINYLNPSISTVPNYTRYRYQAYVDTAGASRLQTDYEKSVIVDWIPAGTANFYISLFWGSNSHYPYSDNDMTGTIYMRVTRIRR